MSWLTRIACRVLQHGPIPNHIAFIMDGNRRYAQDHKGVDGHLRGFEKLTETLEWCLQLGVKVVSVYAFSVDNFKRPPAEVASLMDLARRKFDQIVQRGELVEQHGVRVRVLGALNMLPVEVRAAMERAVEASRSQDRVFLNVCFAYSARLDLADAAADIARDVAHGLRPMSGVDEHALSAALSTGACAHPDILVRTSGETRLSDFLLWESGHAVLGFVPVYWPEFGFWDLCALLLKYQRARPSLQAERRRAELSEQKWSASLGHVTAHDLGTGSCVDSANASTGAGASAVSTGHSPCSCGCSNSNSDCLSSDSFCYGGCSSTLDDRQGVECAKADGECQHSPPRTTGCDRIGCVCCIAQLDSARTDCTARPQLNGATASMAAEAESGAGERSSSCDVTKRARLVGVTSVKLTEMEEPLCDENVATAAAAAAADDDDDVDVDANDDVGGAVPDRIVHSEENSPSRPNHSTSPRGLDGASPSGSGSTLKRPRQRAALNQSSTQNAPEEDLDSEAAVCAPPQPLISPPRGGGSSVRSGRVTVIVRDRRARLGVKLSATSRSVMSRRVESHSIPADLDSEASVSAASGSSLTRIVSST